MTMSVVRLLEGSVLAAIVIMVMIGWYRHVQKLRIYASVYVIMQVPVHVTSMYC